MILSLVLVGDEYIKEGKPYINKFLRFGWTIEILTDQPEKFETYVSMGVTTYYYNKKIFSYFDKLIFPIQISEKYKSGVVYIDSLTLSLIPKNFIETFNGGDDFLYYNTWPKGETFKEYKNDVYFTILVDYFNRRNETEYDDIITILEWIYYIPYSDKNNQLLYDLEEIQPIFEYSTVIYKPHYNGIGNGEGLGLSYCLMKNSIPIHKFKNLELSYHPPHSLARKLI